MVQLLHRSLARVTHTSEVTLQVIDDTVTVTVRHTQQAVVWVKETFFCMP
jgi:hypothetical protein